jgi:DNA-binding transcriptional LysR family regulator
MSLLGPQLEAFLAVHRSGSVSAAAKVVGLTQTGVTQRIRQLERQLNVTVFRRSRKGMHVTAEGQWLLHYCEVAQELEAQTRAKLFGAGTNQTCRVAISSPSSLLRSRIIPRLESVYRKMAHLAFSFVFDDSGLGSRLLKEGEVQFAVVSPSEITGELEGRYLEPERYILVGASLWKTRHLEDILSHEPMIDFDPKDPMTLNYLKKYHLPVNHHERHYVNNTDGLASLVQQGLGFTVLSEEFVQPFLKSRALIRLHKNGHYDHKMCLAWYPRPEMPGYFKAVLDAIVKG